MTPPPPPSRTAEGMENADIMRLAKEDQIRFAEALIDPQEPNARLARAAKRHALLIERK